MLPLLITQRDFARTQNAQIGVSVIKLLVNAIASMVLRGKPAAVHLAQINAVAMDVAFLMLKLIAQTIGTMGFCTTRSNIGTDTKRSSASVIEDGGDMIAPKDCAPRANTGRVKPVVPKITSMIFNL